MHTIESVEESGRIEALERRFYTHRYSGIILYEALLKNDHSREAPVRMAQLLDSGITTWLWFQPLHGIKAWWVEPWTPGCLLHHR